MRRTPALLACALVAVGTLLSRPAPLCACSTELTMRLTVMRSDLLVLAEAQAALRDSTGRYGDLPELTFRSAWPSAGAGVVVLGFASTPAGFSAVLGNTALAGKDGDGMRCAIAVGPNPVHVIDSSRIRDGPQCDPYPIAGGHLLAGIAYLGLLMVSGIVLLLRRPRPPGGGPPPLHRARLARPAGRGRMTGRTCHRSRAGPSRFPRGEGSDAKGGTRTHTPCGTGS